MVAFMIVGTISRFLRRRTEGKMEDLIVQREMLTRASGNGHLDNVVPFEYQKTG